ncbi:MAG: hypothetical protein UU69_C0004G0013 [Candidatus Magasanikbacteria bacterium GW2011_GWA2_41_55]|uniref:Uncharacterized protein n=1 Tax=Candidatus Magasanikbacteria bacterium GW2011_GWA2_41_55 TaxID=1619038 RepID=A0A0G0WN20_9BACT|nr:MAG: hypothetical protein UU69_C0004G0013 [Candidatus Magasanikbacteria bacterium GW2011_GWA2_41_55]
MRNMIQFVCMNNWSVDTKELKKDKKQYAIWRLEQLVNFGLGKEKIKESELRANWSKLRLDPKKKKFLSYLLWPRGKF